ncbi:MAG: hypothetical protein ACK5ZG_12720 [Phycisphaerae bacterium]
MESSRCSRRFRESLDAWSLGTRHNVVNTTFACDRHAGFVPGEHAGGGWTHLPPTRRGDGMFPPVAVAGDSDDAGSSAEVRR